jgi:hypothetical protein
MCSRKMTFLKRLFLPGIIYCRDFIGGGQESWDLEPPDLAMAEKGVVVQALEAALAAGDWGYLVR